MSFVPLFPELISSVRHHYRNRMNDLNNVTAGIINCTYGVAALGDLLTGIIAEHYDFATTLEILGFTALIAAFLYIFVSDTNFILKGEDNDREDDTFRMFNGDDSSRDIELQSEKLSIDSSKKEVNEGSDE
jgi:hypothetical protein